MLGLVSERRFDSVSKRLGELVSELNDLKRNTAPILTYSVAVKSGVTHNIKASSFEARTTGFTSLYLHGRTVATFPSSEVVSLIEKK